MEESRLILSAAFRVSILTVGSPNSFASRAHDEHTSILITSVVTRKRFCFVMRLQRRQIPCMDFLLRCERETPRNGLIKITEERGKLNADYRALTKGTRKKTVRRLRRILGYPQHSVNNVFTSSSSLCFANLCAGSSKLPKA